MAVKISGKVKRSSGGNIPRPVSVRLWPDTIKMLRRKAKAEKTTAHALMREAILAVVAA